MAGIFKARGTSSKHEKLADKWGDYRHSDKVTEGVTYLVKYLGSTLVTELSEEGQSYGDHISGEAVDVVVSMAKASNKKLPTMSLHISPRGIKVMNCETSAVYSDLDIYRICFCTADRVHGKVFAYIARNSDNETMECHAFLCPKRKIAEAVTLTVAESFKLAQDQEEKLEEQRRIERQQQQQQQRVPEKSPSSLNQQSAKNMAALPSSSLGFEDNFVDMKISSSGSTTQNTSLSTTRVGGASGPVNQLVATPTSYSQDLLLL